MKRFIYKNVFICYVCLLFAFHFSLPSCSGILKTPFSKGKHPKKQIQSDITEKSTLKAKAVYLELEGDNVEYDHETNIYRTFGMSIAHIVDQDANLEADEIIYYGDNQHVEAKGNIKITREGIVTTGESFTFDVTSNKYLLTNPETTLKGAIVKARKITGLPENQIEYEKGTLKLNEPVRAAKGFGVKKHPRTFYSYQASKDARKQPTWDDVQRGLKYKVTAEKIVYDRTKELRNLTVYGARVHFKNFSLPLLPKFTTTVSSDPDVRSASLISPTFGTQGALGGFNVGPSFNFNLTKYSILSLSPFGQIGDRGSFGFGGMIGYYGPNTKAEFAYGSLRDRFVGLFKQQLGKKTEFRAAYNQYLDNGFLGATLAKANIELVDKRIIPFPFTESGINLRTGGGWNKGDPKILPSKFAELQRDAGDPKDFKNNAFRVEEQISLVTKPIFKVGNEKLNSALRLRTRNALRAYSTGDLQGIFTGGPILDNKVGPLTFEIGYDRAFVEGDSPLLYDQYILGKESLSLDGDIRLHEWLTLGGYGSYNINDQDIIERQFRAKFGPKDFKMLVNFDALRQQAQFGLNFLFGQPVDFERFVIINSLNRNSGGI